MPQCKHKILHRSQYFQYCPSKSHNHTLTSVLAVLSQYITQLYTDLIYFNTAFTSVLSQYDQTIILYSNPCAYQSRDFTWYIQITNPLFNIFHNDIYTYSIAPCPPQVCICQHPNTPSATNIQFQFDSSDSSLMTYLQNIVLSWGVGQSPGILNRFVTVTRQEGVFLLI